MKVLLIGLGSMGQRHLHLIKETIQADIVCLRSTITESESQNGVIFCSTFEEAFNSKPDFAIIANPTSLHVSTALNLAKQGIPFLIEKPVSHNTEQLDSLLQLVNNKKLPVMVGFHLRHHPSYKLLMNLLHDHAIGDLIHLSGSVGQNLEQWRPSIDYKTNYSAQKKLGGGVILDLTHEIDIATSIMGPVNEVSCISNHYSYLDIDTEDIAEISLTHQHKLSHIHLDYLDHQFHWETRIIGEKGTLVWDYANGYVQLFKNDGSSRLWEDPPDLTRNMIFKEQLIHWLKVLDGKAKPTVTLQEGITNTIIALKCHESSEKRMLLSL